MLHQLQSIKVSSKMHQTNPKSSVEVELPVSESGFDKKKRQSGMLADIDGIGPNRVLKSKSSSDLAHRLPNPLPRDGKQDPPVETGALSGRRWQNSCESPDYFSYRDPKH